MLKIKPPIYVLILTIHSFLVSAEHSQSSHYKASIPQVTKEPQLVDYQIAMESGDLTSIVGHKIENLVTRTPINGQKSSQKTLVFMSYDQSHIYSVFMCYDDSPNLIRSTISPRDEFTRDEDTVALQLVPFVNSQQMYGFQANAVGSQIDGMFSEGTGWDLSFDPVWFTNSLRSSKGYLVKIKVPLTSLRFPPGELQQWDFFVFRGIPRNNEDAYFPQYSTQLSSRISQAGRLENIHVKRQVFKTELKPFMSAKKSQYKAAESNEKWHHSNDSDLGLDAKFVWDDRVVVDLTVNPDFSQIESDVPQIVTNERFTVRFPENRPFFIENAEYFNTPLNLLFTRKVIAPNAGLRTTAQLDDWSIGGMIVDDDSDYKDNIGQKKAKIVAANIRKSIGSDSYFGLFLSDYKRGSSNSKSIALQSRYRFDENWNIDAQAALADNTNQSNKASALHLSVVGAGEFWQYNIQAQSIDEDFESPISFIPRKGITEVKQNYEYRLPANNSVFLAYNTRFELQNIWDSKGHYLDEKLSATVDAELSGQTFLKFTTTNKSERLGKKDYQFLSGQSTFNQTTYTIGAESLWFSRVGFDFNYKYGDSVNYQPAFNLPPKLAKLDQTTLSMSYKMMPELKFNFHLLNNRLDTIDDEMIFSSKQLRLKTTYQFNQDWSLRLIIEQNKVIRDATLSTIDDQNIVIGDVLLKWQSNQGSSLYIGYGAFNVDEGSSSTVANSIKEERSFFLKYTHKLNY